MAIGRDKIRVNILLPDDYIIKIKELADREKRPYTQMVGILLQIGIDNLNDGLTSKINSTSKTNNRLGAFVTKDFYSKIEKLAEKEERKVSQMFSLLVQNGYESFIFSEKTQK